MNHRLLTDAALAVARKSLALVRGDMSDAEAAELFRAFFSVAKAEIGRYDAEAERLRHRLSPVTAPTEEAP